LGVVLAIIQACAKIANKIGCRAKWAIANRVAKGAMRRVTQIKRAGEWDAASAADRVVLDAAGRHRRRVVLSAEGGASFLLDEPQPVLLREGDGLVLDNGAIVQVVGESEPLLELSMRTPLEFVRLAWHLGNRHTDVQIAGGRLRIRCDHVLEDMAARLGAVVRRIDAPFDPEAGDAHGGHRHGD
jgi:urease accessory protein